ncbi:hypothetical protein ESCAB7627_1644 [Escherichia albertii TW07627]|uniref:Uncharacterized protein n=1 Tax=Escherichia albertii (strain TW07627) TaxID=502347 RepID=A0ABC9NRZ0_ESCAT|nr:hypothetical protein ESCAB7627_1644 [Escherichia albertii TW07627]OSL33429.1 hypothetical protein EAPG_02131 [Escherichia albertii B156]
MLCLLLQVNKKSINRYDVFLLLFFKDSVALMKIIAPFEVDIISGIISFMRFFYN